MKTLCAAVLSIVGLLAVAGSLADTGEEIYKAKCSLCHDSGAGQAPKIGDKADWSRRVLRGRDAIYETALKGKPNTAMAAKGGHAELSDAEVTSTVDYMLVRSGYDPRALPAVSPVQREEPAAEARSSTARSPDVDDKTITASIAEALRRDIAPPGAKVETYAGTTIVRGVGIKIETHAGVVVLSGMVPNAEVIERAEKIAKAADGVRSVENKLVPAAIFEWD